MTLRIVNWHRCVGPKSRVILSILLGVATWCVSNFKQPKAEAATDTWVGAATANWNGTDWTGGNAPPVSTDALVFDVDGAAGTGNSNVLTNDLTTSRL